MPKTDQKPKEVEVFAPKKAGDATGGAGFEKSGAPELSVLTSWDDTASEAARAKHWEWFVIDQFLRGNHNVRGNPNDNTIVVTQKNDTINYPINKVFSTFRAVRAFVTRHKPKITVEPVDGSEPAKTYARQAQAILDRDNQLNNYRRINKEWSYYGVKYGLGWRQIGYDREKKCAIRWTVDPFDLLVGSKTGKADDAPYLIKNAVRTIGYLKDKFPNTTAHLAPDNLVAADEYKRLALEMIYPNANVMGENDNETVIIKEAWYRLYKPNKNGGFINKALFTKSGMIDFVETPYDEYNFIPYESDVIPNELYPEGHVKHIISPQRMLNMLETQLLEYNHLVNRGRFLKDKNAGFKVIYAKEGQIIEKNPGKSVQVLNPPGINPALPQQIEHANSYIEDIGGQHDASFGVTPARVTSGNAIEALQQGDSNNISDLRDNFEDSLSLEAAWILKMYSLFEHEGVTLSEKVDGQDQTFTAVGQVAAEKMDMPVQEKIYTEDNGGYNSVCAILPDNKVKVSVTSELGETKEAKMDLLFKLVEVGLPLKFILENIEFPNTSDVFERIAQESLAELKLQAMGAAMGAPPAGAAPGGPPAGAPPMPPPVEAGPPPPPPPPPGQ